MYDEEVDIREQSCSLPSRREAEAECKHINRMQHGVNPNIEEGRAKRQRKERAKQYERWAKQRAKGLDVSRSPSPPLSSVNLDRSSPYEYGSNEINSEEQNEQRNTISPFGTFKTYTREGIPWNINFEQDTQGSLIKDKFSYEESTTILSEKTTSRQANQTFKKYLQQVKASGQGIDYRVPIINSTTKSRTT